MGRTGIEGRIGVTRVARVTGLDRTGVEVACAVRPLGHVLQVSNGKGVTFAEARASAVAEAAELWAAERVDAGELVFGSLAELLPRLGRARIWSAAELGSAGGLAAPALWSPRTRIAWRAAESLVGGPPVLVPAQAIHCPPAGGPPLGPAIVRWTSNGMGAHPRRERALEHALLEALERDRLARWLPRGFTVPALGKHLVSPASLPAALRARVVSLRERGFAAHFLDLGLPGSPPCAAALLVDLEEGPVPLTAGYACRRDPAESALAALLEAAQSRLTDIHGAREDVAPADRGAMRRLAGRLARARPGRRFSARSYRGSLTHGLARAAAVELSPPGLGLSVVKVIVPGLCVSELL